MEGPHPGGTAFRITVSPVPGKYALMPHSLTFIPMACTKIMVCIHDRATAKLKQVENTEY